MSGAGAAQTATPDRTLHSSLTGTLRGPPAQASGPEGRSGIVTPREKKVSLFFVRSADNQADFFTKPLPASAFFPMRNRIMNLEDGSAP